MKPTAVLAVAVALVVAVASVADLLLIDWFGPLIVLPYALGTFAWVGLIVALRRPRHPIGWLFLAAGACFVLNLTSRAYAWRALVDAPGTLPGGELALLLCTILAPLGNGVLPVLALIFPTGRPPWRHGGTALVAMFAGGLVAYALARAFAPTPLVVPYAISAPPPPDQLVLLPKIPNPIGISGPAGDALAAIVPALDGILLPVVLVCVFAFVVRFVRSRGTERLQMKWFVYVTSLSLACFVGAGTLHTGTLSGIFWVLSEVFLGLVPVAVGIAILRYRLYDIDVLINRTLVYGATTATLVAVYTLAALVAHALLRPFTQGSELAVAVSTLAVAALIQPVRRRIQSAVDQRFYRSSYDAARTVEALALRMRDEVDIDALRRELVAVARDTMQPSHASVWLRGGR
ncbi:MAG TPA: hypothetical protein VI056_01210 [Candidatus Limnocylindria bacterium]